MMLAINPQTLQLDDSVLMPEMAVSPHTITMFNDQMMIYTAGNNLNLQKLYRYVWNPSRSNPPLQEAGHHPRQQSILRIAWTTLSAATGRPLAQSPALPPGVNERFGHTSLRGWVL
jgi:hypothetical protein